VVLVIDTSSACSGLALLRPEAGGWQPEAERVFPSGRGEELAGRVRELVDPRRLTGVAVALGPGSFTGVRVGASYGLGLAMGLGIPLFGLGTLELAAARAGVPATGLAEAGRGRVYSLPPGGEPELGDPDQVPDAWPAAGWLRPTTAEALRAAGVRLLDPPELTSFADAAARSMRGAERVGYGTVRLRYMSSAGRLQR
jgi:tRNA threonylcarbamoyl adenosine modification protein YeaZ